MPQIAYTEKPPERTHLVIGVPAPVTLCGHIVFLFGDLIPLTRDRWPEPVAPWCDACEKSCLGE